MNLPVRRTRDNAVIAGVCAGLARRWGIDPNLLRIALVIGTLASGLGLVLYGVAYLMLPADDSSPAPVRRILPFTNDWPVPATAAALTVAGMVGFGMAGGWSGIGLLPVLVALGIWYVVNRKRRGAGTATADPTPFERAADAWRTRLVEQQVASGALPATAVAPVTAALVPSPVPVAAAADIVRRPHRNGRLWWLALGLSAVGAGVVALLQAQGLGSGPLPYLAVMLASLGLTLLVSTWRGRPPLIGLVTVVVMLSTLGTWAAPAATSMGEVRFVSDTLTYTGATVLPPEISATAGDLSLDLSGLELTDDTALQLTLGAGDVTLRLPKGLNSTVTWNIVAGDVTVPGDPAASGLNLAGTTSHKAGGAAAPTLTIHVALKAGSLEVLQ